LVDEETMAKLKKKDRREEALGTTAQSPGDTRTGASERDRVAMRAYERYLERGAADGAAVDDWLAAERELASDDPDRQPE
jgi:hypothetical protein